MKEYESKVTELQKELAEIDKGISELSAQWDNIESAQSIINSLSETANIVNNTVIPMEFFEGYEKMYYLVAKLETIPDIEYSQQPPSEIKEELQGQRKPAIQNMIGRYYNYAVSKGYFSDIFRNELSKYFSYMDNDHINYINSLCQNWGKNKEDKTKRIRKIKIFYLNFSYIVNIILFPPAKVVFMFWTFYWIKSFSDMLNQVGFLKAIAIIFLGYLIMCGIADLIYYSKQEKYTNYKIKILERKTRRLKKIMKEIDPVRYQRDFGNSEMVKTYFSQFDFMDGHEFEYYCADLLRKNGFTNVEVTQGSGDHGIDILAEKDGITYAIQCKRYDSNIGNAAVQQAHTGKSLYHRDIAVVMTNQYFTQQASEEAAQLGVKLWNRDYLLRLGGEGE